ncbi:peptide-methionine (S)-S-oxide reductase [Marixanthomonas ophiurae]|uniref:peptide-methionine (S)-S-oxide reductase n=1 Tax=Marixanthomonas ophiurae TaxID=387659 RepID=A0A3E1Q7R0_9FLAO|nr:peptide-methionine (S)-S-oxide reductase [Marixanthomonas ophiurae]RFN58177.1 peptide methionine sulfoxide reductase [Marixanthomonas ophiurae]
MHTKKIALGGGCHWCTEAVFQSLVGVERVELGYVASTGDNTSFSEAVVVHFNPEKINLKTLIEIHLHTHKSTSNHSLRERYRSAVYYFNVRQEQLAQEYIKSLQRDFDELIISEVLPFSAFKPSRESLHNYYKTNPERPFCKRFINPKIKLLLHQFSKHMRSMEHPVLKE